MCVWSCSAMPSATCGLLTRRLPCDRHTSPERRPAHLFAHCVAQTLRELCVEAVAPAADCNHAGLCEEASAARTTACEQASHLVLVSDDPMSATLASALPSLRISSPLLDSDGVPPIHTEFPERFMGNTATGPTDGNATYRAVQQTLVDVVMLSSCDGLIHSRSSFSKLASEWGGIPEHRLRLLPRHGAHVALQWTECPADTRLHDYYHVV